MLKKDLLAIFTGAEIAKIIQRHQAQVTRMPKEVPPEYRKTLIIAARRKIRKGNTALKRLEEQLKNGVCNDNL